MILNQRAMSTLDSLLPDNAHICDRKGLGCQGCNLCSTLITKAEYPIYTLNLSSSGLCRYTCCDCYAKIMQSLLKKWGYLPICFDRIQKNSKQKGITKHILYAKNKLK